MRMISSKGSSLPELLIALFISSLMLLVMGSTYVSIKNHYLWQTSQFSKAQESLLLADWLKSEIHLAGVLGCRPQSDLLNVTPAQPSKNKGVYILERSSLMLPKAVRRAAIKGSDVLLINKSEGVPSAITHSQKGSKLITLLKPTTLKVGQSIRISDCGSLFDSTIKTISPSRLKLTLASFLPSDFSLSASIVKRAVSILYIRKINDEKALYISDGVRSEELVRHITYLKALKKGLKNKSLIYLELHRLHAPSLHLYVAMYGE